MLRTSIVAGSLGLLLISAGVAHTAKRPTFATPLHHATTEVSPLRPAFMGNRGPFKIAFRPDGTQALVTEFDEGALAVIDRRSGKVTRHIPTGGEQPTGVAISPNGEMAIVTNSLSGSIAFLDLNTYRAQIVPLRGMPWDVVFAPDGTHAYVSVSQLDRVAVISVADRKVVGFIPTGRRPRALAITPDGATLAVANMASGSVSYLDTRTQTEKGVGRTPAVNLRGVALFPDGRRVFAVGQRAQNERATETPVGIWSNQAFLQVPNGPRNGVQNLWLDLMGKDVSDPDSVVLDAQHGRAFVTCTGGHSLNVFPLGDGDTMTVQHIGVAPRGLAFTPDGKEIWVANSMSNDLTVVNPDTLQIERRIDLGPTSRKDPTLPGRFLFTTATIVKGEQFSCNSCHPDGGVDGISWKFTHVPDALGKTLDRNVKSLRGHIGDHPPYRWSGRDASLTDFIQEEAKGLLQSPAISKEEVQQIADYIQSLPEPPNPYRNLDGMFTQEALQGKALFKGKAGCVQCHAADDTPRNMAATKAWIGTTPAGVQLQPPHLHGVFDTYPYLHDGSAATLEEVFSGHNANNLHGNAHTLTESEMKTLLQYVKQL